MQNLLILHTPGCDPKGSVEAWGHNGELPSPRMIKAHGHRFYETPMEAMAAGWKLLAPPERWKEGARQFDGSGLQETFPWRWWFVREEN